MNPQPRRTTDKLSALRRQLCQLESGFLSVDRPVISSGSAALDCLLPAGGFCRGTLVEWLSAVGGNGTGTLAVIAAREAALQGGVVVVIDRGRWFYPPAAACWGIDLEKLIVIRPRSHQDELWALDQTLRCAGVAAVWSPLPAQLDQRNFRRLQLAAERGGGLGLLLRSDQVRGRPSWSDVQLLVEPTRCPTQEQVSGSFYSGGRRLRIQLIRSRGQVCGGSVELEIDDVTGVVKSVSESDGKSTEHLAARLAAPAPPRRSARA